VISNEIVKFRYHIECKTKRVISGWCICAKRKMIEVRCIQKGKSVGYRYEKCDRPDVESSFPGNPYSLHSGFKIQVDKHQVSPQSSCHLEYKFDDGSVEKSHDFILDPDKNEMLTFPNELGLGDVDPVDYLLFINTMWNKFLFIEKFFPKFNQLVIPGSKDEYCISTSPREMLHIANHIYRLKMLGYSGSGVICEFGCFKGFSTSCLSHACHYLGLKLEVFDSFAGLPETDSNYYKAGDFYGSIEEVTENVSRFGKIDSVNFNKGFFSDSLKNKQIDPIMIWMDVDLQSSSRDAMKIFEQMPLQGCIMSHECFARNFSENTIKPDGGEGDVITPIIEAMNVLNRKTSGMWLIGGLGAFWDSDYGVVPISNDMLNKVIDLIK
jgi:hypothetical protein